MRRVPARLTRHVRVRACVRVYRGMWAHLGRQLEDLLPLALRDPLLISLNHLPTIVLLVLVLVEALLGSVGSVGIGVGISRFGLLLLRARLLLLLDALTRGLPPLGALLTFDALCALLPLGTLLALAPAARPLRAAARWLPALRCLHAPLHALLPPLVRVESVLDRVVRASWKSLDNLRPSRAQLGYPLSNELVLLLGPLALLDGGAEVVEPPLAALLAHAARHVRRDERPALRTKLGDRLNQLLVLRLGPRALGVDDLGGGGGRGVTRGDCGRDRRRVLLVDVRVHARVDAETDHLDHTVDHGGRGGCGGGGGGGGADGHGGERRKGQRACRLRRRRRGDRHKLAGSHRGLPGGGGGGRDRARKLWWTGALARGTHGRGDHHGCHGHRHLQRRRRSRRHGRCHQRRRLS